jgi:hypothetical protein
MKTSTLITLAFGSLFISCTAASAQVPSSALPTPIGKPCNALLCNASDLATAVPRSTVLPPHAHSNGQAHARSGIPNIDSLVNFSDHYFAYGVDSNGHAVREWYTNTVGNPPNTPGTTTLNAPIVPVIIDLRNSDGSPLVVNGNRFMSDPTQYVKLVLNSPVFQNYTYTSSSTPTQFSDAVQRAQYWNSAKPNWHTVLTPSVKTTRTMTLTGGYQAAPNSDGTCCAWVKVDADTFVNALFPPPTTPGDTTTPIGAAENDSDPAGHITTKDISTFLFANTFLYVNGDPYQCCITGFHTYDYVPGTDSNGNVEKRYVLNFSSWISPGLFNDPSQDITVLSHEIAEIYNDPFVASDGIHNMTPWWLGPNGNCQNKLETGDVIERLPNATFPITMNGYTYHPQNEALLQWFQYKAISDAIGNAFSYPDTSILTAQTLFHYVYCGG